MDRSVMMYWVEGISSDGCHLEGTRYANEIDADRERFILSIEFSDNQYWVERGYISEDML